MTLLDKALSAPRRMNRHSLESLTEELDLAIAYAERRVSGNQASAALGKTTRTSRQNISQTIGGIFISAWSAGLLAKKTNNSGI